MEREVELKLELAEADAARLHQHPLLAKHEPSTASQTSIYYDTPVAALAGAGFSLRIRKKNDRFVQTVKRVAAASAGLYDRDEWEVMLSRPKPDLDALAATPLPGSVGKEALSALEPVSKVVVERTIWNVPVGSSQVEVVLDGGQVRSGKRREPIVELEAELKAGDPAALFEVVKAIAETVPVKLGVRTKHERGRTLASGEAPKARKAEPIELDDTMDVRKGFVSIVSACLRQFRLNEQLVLDQRDPAALHQMRVAMRRLRSALTLFRPAISDERYEPLREELRWFTDQIGAARNQDVLLTRFGNLKGNTGKRVAERLETARDQAYAQVEEALSSRRFQFLMLELVEWLQLGIWRASELASQPIAKFAAAALDRRWRRVKRGGRGMAQLSPDPLHRLRIEGKKLRYALDFFAGLYPERRAAKRHKKATAALAELQEVLGDLNDEATAGEILPELFKGDSEALAAVSAPSGKSASMKSAVVAHRDLMKVGTFWREERENKAAAKR